VGEEIAEYIYPILGNLLYFSIGLAMVAGAVIGLCRLARETMDHRLWRREAAPHHDAG